MMRRRIFGLALIALVVPFPALALDGGGSPSAGGATLTVSASLDSCGLGGAQIMCKIDAGWNSLEGAESYSVSVTSADGSVVDYGTTSGQGMSVWVPYVGSGSYSVNVTAWGTPPGEDDDGSPEVLARSESASSAEAGGVARTLPDDTVSDPRDPAVSLPAAEEPVAPDVPEVGDPREELPVCEEPVAEEAPPPPAEDETAAVPADEDTRAVAPVEPEVVDTIPVDGDCTS